MLFSLPKHTRAATEKERLRKRKLYSTEANTALLFRGSLLAWQSFFRLAESGGRRWYVGLLCIDEVPRWLVNQKGRPLLQTIHEQYALQRELLYVFQAEV